MDYCKPCREYLFGQKHVCPPEWECLDKDCFGDDWLGCVHVRAHDAEDAATKAAELMDEGEGASKRKITVRETGKETETTFSISYEFSIDYYAHEIEKGAPHD